MPRRLVSLLITLALAVPVAAHAAGKDDKKDKDKTLFIQLQTISATMLRVGGRRGVLTVEVGIDAPDMAVRNRIELLQPVLTDAFVSALQPYALGVPAAAAPSADYISMSLQHQTDRVLGRPGAKLLLGSILIY
jgi:hypothetical protein